MPACEARIGSGRVGLAPIYSPKKASVNGCNSIARLRGAAPAARLAGCGRAPCAVAPRSGRRVGRAVALATRDFREGMPVAPCMPTFQACERNMHWEPHPCFADRTASGSPCGLRWNAVKGTALQPNEGTRAAPVQQQALPTPGTGPAQGVAGQGRTSLLPMRSASPPARVLVNDTSRPLWNSAPAKRASNSSSGRSAPAWPVALPG